MEKLCLSSFVCPRCGNDSLREVFIPEPGVAMRGKSYECVLLCGMVFSLDRLTNGKIRIYYHKENEDFLRKRFHFFGD